MGSKAPLLFSGKSSREEKSPRADPGLKRWELNLAPLHHYLHYALRGRAPSLRWARLLGLLQKPLTLTSVSPAARHRKDCVAWLPQEKGRSCEAEGRGALCW